jgi:hypothetical protein
MGDGAVVTYHVWIPSGSQITFVQAYVQQGASGGWTFTADYQPIANLTTNAWNTLTVTVPSNAVLPIDNMGVQFGTGATWSGTVYVDSISW